MDKTVNISEAKTHLSELVKRVMMGERIVITKAGTPVAVLTPIDEILNRRTPGLDAGKVIIAPDFDDHLSDFEL
jgi:prevent-host-death family protein